MINAELLEKLSAMSAEVAKLETEAKRTVDNVNEKIAKSRAEKEVRIVEFLHTLEEAFKFGGFPRMKDYSCPCCGLHWEGAPNTQGSHGRSIVVTFMVRGNSVHITFGRWFDGCQQADKLLEVCAEKLVCSNYLTHRGRCAGGTLRENIIERWDTETERSLSDWMVKIVTANLEKRLGTATQALKDANDKYDAHFEEENV